MSLDREWNHLEFTLHEVPGVHRPLEEELTFYHAVKEGELAYVTENCTRQIFLQPEGMGLLSENLLQNVRYHFVVTAAMIPGIVLMEGWRRKRPIALVIFIYRKWINVKAGMRSPICTGRCAMILPEKCNCCTETVSFPGILYGASIISIAIFTAGSP